MARGRREVGRETEDLVGVGGKRNGERGLDGGAGGGGAITGNRSYQLIAIPNIMTGRDQENNGQNTA